MSDGVQRGEATVSRSVRDCLPICLPSTTRHSTFQRTPADDVPAYLAPRPPGGRQWHGRSRAPNLGPIWAQRPRLGITERLLDRCRLLHPRSFETPQTGPADLGVKESGLWRSVVAHPMRSDVCCQIAAKNDQVPFAVTPKGTLTRTFVVAGGGFEPPTSGL